MRLSIFQLTLALGACLLPAIGQAQESQVPVRAANAGGPYQAYYPQQQAAAPQGQLVNHQLIGHGGHHGGQFRGGLIHGGHPHAAVGHHPGAYGHGMPGQVGHVAHGAVPYPKQHAPTAWPYVGSYYPYPQVPLGWKNVTLEWADGYWFLDFDKRRPGSR